MITELAQFYHSQGIEPVILTKKWPLTLSETDEYKGVKIYRVISARTESEFLSIMDWVSNNVGKIKADIIHVIGARRPLPLVALLLSRYWNIPLVTTIAGSEIPNTGDSQTNAVWNEGREIIKPVLEKSDIVTCVSKALENDLGKIVPDIKSTKTIYAGIDIELINSINSTETEKEYIISLRRLVPSKGIDVLIKAFKEITNEYPHMKLLVAGEGPEEVNLKNLVHELKIGDSVKFLGTVTFERAVSLLKGAICTVVPSLSEGGSLVNVEAQAASCAVVASNVGGIPEYVQENVSGLLFKTGDTKDLANKLRTIISDVSVRNKLIQGGIEHAKKFSWKVLGPQYLALYNEMVNMNRSEQFEPWSDLTTKMWAKLIK